MTVIRILFLSVLALGLLPACSSPEEKTVSHLANADALLAQNKLQKARVEYASALQINQNLPEAWYGLARIHERQGQWKEAFRILTRVRDTNPKFMDGRVMLTKLLLASNQIEQALEDARDIVALSPDDARSHAIMASVQFRLGELGEARKSAERALALDPRNAEAMQMKASLLMSENRFRDALQVLDEALQVHTDNETFYLLKLAALNELGDEAAVEQTYETLIRIFPDKDEFRFALVRRYVTAGNIDQAERVLMRSIAKNPDSTEEKLRLVIFRSNHRSLDDAIGLVTSYIGEEQNEYEYKFVLGELYLRNGQTDRAIALYRDIMREQELAPEGLEARNRIARIYQRAGKLEESRALVDEVLAHDKNNKDGLVLAAKINLLEGNPAQAVAGLRTVLRDYPDSVEALNLIGQGHSAMGADSLAIEAFSMALKREPGAGTIANRLATVMLRSNEPEQAEQVLLSSIEAGNDTVDALKLLTQAKMMLGDWQQAEQLARRLQSYEGEESVSQHVLGLVYRNRQQSEESIAAFKRAHDLDPGSSEPIVALVQVFLESEQPDKAREFLLSVIDRNPENAMAYQMLGQLSLTQNDLGTAIRRLQQAVAANPQLDKPYLQLASIYIGEGQMGKAREVLQQGLAELPYSLQISMNLALVVESQGEFDQAIELYEDLLRTNPDIMVAKNNLANLLLDHRGDEASIARARELAAGFRDANLPVFRDTYAWASIKSGSFLQEAIAILRGLLRDNEAVGLYHYHIGEAYRKNGDKFEARKHLRRAIELESPGSAVAIAARKALALSQ